MVFQEMKLYLHLWTVLDFVRINRIEGTILEKEKKNQLTAFK